MSDLLSDVRALNPVPACEAPPIEDVWSKLQRFETVADRRSTGRRSWSPRLGVVATAAAIAAVAILLAVTGGQAGGRLPRGVEAAAAVERLAAGTISCDLGGSRVVTVPTDGRPAVAYCRGRDGTRARLIACRSSATDVSVHLADGRPGQCHRLGDADLPAGYATAVRDDAPASV